MPPEPTVTCFYDAYPRGTTAASSASRCGTAYRYSDEPPSLPVTHFSEHSQGYTDTPALVLLVLYR